MQHRIPKIILKLVLSNVVSLYSSSSLIEKHLQYFPLKFSRSSCLSWKQLLVE
jgi:hypothetical protein